MPPQAPKHGGLRRFAINGGATLRSELPFLALSANIDNWSPYWYKLNPVEVYIPPFTYDKNVRLPLLQSFELIAQAPPGIEQSTVVTTSAVPGNFQPVIAIFSSFDSNNDSGLGAIDAAANIVAGAGTTTSGASGSTAFDLDMTLYNGVEITFTANTSLVLTIYSRTVTASGNLDYPVYSRVFYTNEIVELSVPKLGPRIYGKVTSDPNNIVAPLQWQVATRRLLGIVQWQETYFSWLNPQGEGRSTSGATQTLLFTTTGITECSIIARPTGGTFVSGDILGIDINNSLGPNPLYRATWRYNGADQYSTRTIPLTVGGDDLTVKWYGKIGGTVTISIVHYKLPEYVPAGVQPSLQVVLPANVWTNLGAVGSQGYLAALEALPLANGAVGTYIFFALSTLSPALGGSIFIGNVPQIYNRFSLREFVPISLGGNLLNLWAFNQGAVAIECRTTPYIK